MARYHPGTGKPKKRYAPGAYVEERVAWVDTVLGNQVLMFYPESPESAKEEGPIVRILMPQHRRPTVSWDLTYLTEDELNALREFFELAFDLAAPLVRERDRIANEAAQRGDDSYARLYRRLPQLVVRKRPVTSHSEGVCDGSESLPGSDRRGDDPAGRVRGPGGGVADDDEGQGGSQDDGTETD